MDRWTAHRRWWNKTFPESGSSAIVRTGDFCAANNQGIQASQAEFVALLNNDAEAEPEWLEALLGAFDGRPECGMGASKILVYEDPGPNR